MSSGDIERIRTKLFALNMRFDEVNSAVAETQARVFRLEKKLEDAKLAALLGEEGENPSEIAPQLEISRLELNDRQQLLRSIRSSQWETRVRYLLARRHEIQAQKAENQGE